MIKMKKTKRIVALLMSAVMSLSLAGCGNKQTAGNDGEKKEDPITLTVYSQTANYSGIQTGWFGDILLDKFNVKLNIIPDSDGTYDTRMESGNLGDIIVWGSDGSEYLNAVAAGMLYDWEEENLVQEYGPYIWENMHFALEKNKRISTEAGDVCYGFGNGVATNAENHDSFFYTWDIRWDLYKQLGYPEVKNFDDLVDVFVKMKEICPVDDKGEEVYAVSLWPDWDANMVMYVKAMATAYYGYDELGIGLYNVETGEFYDCLAENGPYLTALKFFNKLYQKGLLDPDSMTQTYQDAIEKVQNGGTLFSIFNYSGYLAYNETHIADGKMMSTLLPEEASPIVYGMNVFGGTRIWSIGAKTEYPELCMEIINWLSTPEGRMVSEYGPEGVCWYYDDNKDIHFTELGKKCHYDVKTEMGNGYAGTFQDGQQQINNITWSIDAENPDSNGESYNCEAWKSNQSPAEYEIEQDWRDYTGFDNIQQYLDSKNYCVAIGSLYSESTKTDELNVLWKQVITCITTNTWLAMYAKTDEEFDAAVAKMRKDAYEYGYEQCVEWSINEAALRKSCEDDMRK